MYGKVYHIAVPTEAEQLPTTASEVFRSFVLVWFLFGVGWRFRVLIEIDEDGSLGIAEGNAVFTLVQTVPIDRLGIPIPGADPRYEAAFEFNLSTTRIVQHGGFRAGDLLYESFPFPGTAVIVLGGDAFTRDPASGDAKRRIVDSASGPVEGDGLRDVELWRAVTGEAKLPDRPETVVGRGSNQAARPPSGS